MIQMWLGFTAPQFPGSGWVAPVLGTFVFAWGGWPFLKGGFDEARSRQPGMMLLIAMAITVAFVASAATTLGVFDLDFWWELALLVTIMLLGHWLEMRAVGQASGALEALAELLVGAGQLARALEAALSAVRAEPLRESAHRALIRVHLAEGNRGEAQRQYDLCRRLLRERLDTAPRALLERRRTAVDHAGARLQALSPDATLARGYAVVRAEGSALREAAAVAPGDALEIQLAAGALGARVEETRP
jgi:tetratricopeptide (TPR) repeat protein